MRIAAKLGTIDLVMTYGRWFEPDRYAHARNRILGHTHRNHFEGMDDVSRTDIRHHGLINDDVHFTEGQLNVVLAIRIGRVNAEGIGRVDKMHFLLAPLAILAGITRMPVELLADDLDLHSISAF